MFDRDRGCKGVLMGAGDVEDIYELSPLQQGILFHSLFGGDSDVYVNQRSYIIDGPIQIDTLVAAWNRASDAHTAVRTSFHWDGLDKPLQVVHRNAPIPVHQHDWTGAPESERTERFDKLIADDLSVGVDPARPPLQRLNVVRFEPGRYGLVWTHHLLLLDGWSVPIFINDVLRWYYALVVGGPSPESAPPFRDYIAWLQRQDVAAARDYWVRALANHGAVNPIGVLRPADPQRGAGPLGERVIDVPPPLEAALRATAARHRVTLNTVLHAGWSLVLRRYTGSPEVMFGVTSSCRPPDVPGIEKMVGLFTNSLPVRVTVPDDADIGAWLTGLQATYTDVRRHEYTPLSQVKQWAAAPAAREMFDSLFIFDNYSLSVAAGDDLSPQLAVRSVSAVEKTSQPLVVIATPEPQFTLRVRFHENRFPTNAADEILDCFQTMLTAVTSARRIADIDAAAVAGQRIDNTTRSVDVTAAAEGIRYADADQTLPDLVRRQSSATPDALAVVSDKSTVTYAQLVRHAEQIAATLETAGVGVGDVVGICAERSPAMVAGVLGVLLAGAAYLPLDPSLPEGRLGFMLDDARAGVVLADRPSENAASAAGARQVLTLDNPPTGPIRDRGLSTSVPMRGSGAAYVMYTSGSTGRPKGVVITHHAIVNRLLWMQHTFGLTPADRVLQKTPFGFDVSVWELFWPLIVGATMVLARPGGHQDADYLAESIDRQGVTTAHFVPSMLQLFLDEPGVAKLRTLRRVICSGEALAHDLVRRCQRVLSEAELHNLYGPTEAAVDVTWWNCAWPGPEGTIPIGHAIANTQAFVLDQRLAEAPCNVPGELYLGGVQLAQGYINQPGLTASRFVAHQLAGPGRRLYRTGDRVRRLADGSLEYLGRLDEQVKVHGYRIELGEIEHVLRHHLAVRDAAVVVHEVDRGHHLAAYVTSDRPAGQPLEFLERDLRDYLRRNLPGYMVPASFTVLPAMPLTHNGKLDRAALPHPVRTASTGAARMAPANPREQAIAAVYSEILGLPEVDITRSFFDLGGNSYDAVRAIRRIDGATVGILAANASVRALANALEDSTTPSSTLVPLGTSSQAGDPLVCVPFGGGNALSYQPLARELPADIRPLAVSLPGHEFGGEAELCSVEEVVDRSLPALRDLGATPVTVYGHCAGVAVAVEIVRRLEAEGRPVRRLFVGGSYPFYELGAFPRALLRVLAGGRVTAGTLGNASRGGLRADVAEMRYLQSIGGFESVVDEETLQFVMRTFRHDVAEGSRYFSERWRRSETPPLTTPITFIAGTNDPLTRRYERRAALWQRFSAAVELRTVSGGHYFHQQQSAQLARVIVETLATEQVVPNEITAGQAV